MFCFQFQFQFQLNCDLFISFLYACPTTRILGNKELGLIPFDPLKLEKFSIVQNEQSPVNIRLHVRNITLTGLKDIAVSKVVLVIFTFFSLLLLVCISSNNLNFIYSIGKIQIPAVSVKIWKHPNSKWPEKRKGSKFSAIINWTDKCWFFQ